MRRIVLLAGGVAAGVAAYVLLRSPQRSEPGALAAAPDLHDAAAAPVTRPAEAPPPSLRRPAGAPGDHADRAALAAGAPTGGPARAPSLTFEHELRDPAWATEQEKELTLRLRGIVDALAARDTPIDVDAIECRSSQCKVSVHARDEVALGKLYAALESTDGVYGWADNLLLAPVTTAPDGSVTTHVVALFERD